MEKENLYSPEALINLIIEGDLPISRIAKEQIFHYLRLKIISTEKLMHHLCNIE